MSGTNTTPDLAGLCERLRATRVTYRYKDGYPVKTAKRTNPDGPEAAAAIERLVAALEPFSEGARMAAISGRPPFEFCDAADYRRARTALEGASDDR